MRGMLLRLPLPALFACASLANAQSGTALPASGLDPRTFAQWVAGGESAFEGEALKHGPAGVVRAEGAKVDWRGVKYGEGRAGGARHLRVGFTEPVKTGTVAVRGGGALSVLKEDAAYPGDLADDSQWLAAERLVDGLPSRAEVTEEGYALWVLPTGTRTRALRFSHTPSAGDRESAGWLGGAEVLPERMGNAAPQALAQSAARDDVSAKLVDESNNRQWETWDNGEDGATRALSAENPEIVTLTWPAPVKLSGLCLLWTGFTAVEVDSFTGNAAEIPREAPDSSWKPVTARTGMDPLYPLPLGPNWLPFPAEVETRAVRLRITGGSIAPHSHLEAKIKDGRRVWLGEVQALAPLGEAALTTLVLPKNEEEPPPIPVKFTLPEAGLVTLVIDDASGHRVRNLVSETPFPAGDNIAWWDGGDDLLRDPQAAKHGVYHIPARPVAPGDYKICGLWHKPLGLRYEFSVYNAGKPPWSTVDNTGGWMTTHTPPTSMAFVPGARTADGQPLVLMGAYIAEGGHGLQWLREDGTKLGGQGWVGGHWTGAPTLAVDAGPRAVADDICYVGSIWEGELRLTAKTRGLEDRPVFKSQLGADPRPEDSSPGDRPRVLEGFDGGDKIFVLGGLAARDGMLVCALPRQNELLFVNASNGLLDHRESVPDPRGLTFDAEGRLLVLSGTRLLLWPDRSVVVRAGLEDPRHVVTDAAGRHYITDRGASHQVKVFSPSGGFLRAIGAPGAPAVGSYDPRHMNNPNGLALDSQGRLWVAEADNFPRRVSVWSAEGELVRAFYGPTEYGGGGVLDSREASRFFYKGMEFDLDWKAGTDQLKRVFARPDPLLESHGGHYSPDTPLYPRERGGDRYFTSCYTHNPTGGDDAAFLWRDDGNTARLVAGLGDAHAWEALAGPDFLTLWPEGTAPGDKNRSPDRRALFSWSDANRDGKPQPDEVRMIKGEAHGVTTAHDLSFLIARLDGHAVRFRPRSFDVRGAPTYDLASPEKLGPAGGQPPSSGGDQALSDDSGWTVTTNAPAPFSPYGLGGSFGGEARWSYPSVWPGLHASHEAAVPDRSGMIVGHTRLLGGLVNGNAGPMFAINGNMGNAYLLTADGLFVSTLFHDVRLRPKWATPAAFRDMDVTGVSLHDENFWPSITQTADGKIFLVDGGRTSLVRVDGLDTLQRLPDQTLTVTAGDLDKARAWFARAEAARQRRRGSGVLKVALRATAPVVDGKLDDWPAATDWAPIDRRGVKANFDSQSRPYDVSAAVSVSGEHLFAAWRTTEKDLLVNSGATPNALFKTGGCLDLMLQTDTAQRLLVTRVNGKPRALLYRQTVPGTAVPVAFSSPWRTISIDSVEDVTALIALASDAGGNHEISIPLTALHWRPEPEADVRADLGVLRGADFQTTQRVYWSNKATAITADVPSEAELTPDLWGRWTVIQE